MNYFTLFPLQGYWGKFAGLSISTIAIILLLIYEFLGQEYLPVIIQEGKQVSTLLWLFCLGLFILTFSKEKIDDERVQKIRYTALRAMAFFCFIGLFSVFSPLSIDSEGIANEDIVPLILLLLVFPLVGYQIIFNLGLYLNPAWAYNDLGAEENIRKNPKFFHIYAIVITIILIVFLIIRGAN
ncbi:MAG TPA: hypothetical protein VK927_08060 [Adhaeribacter sp.]|nr:hypothetical protein [Adhaeribacter sp.]